MRVEDWLKDSTLLALVELLSQQVEEMHGLWDRVSELEKEPTTVKRLCIDDGQHGGAWMIDPIQTWLHLMSDGTTRWEEYRKSEMIHVPVVRDDPHCATCAGIGTVDVPEDDERFNQTEPCPDCQPNAD